MTEFDDWLRARGIDSPRRVVRASDDAILVSKFEPGFAARLHDALARMPELFDVDCAVLRYASLPGDTPRVEAWRLAMASLLEWLAPERDISRDQLAEIQAGVDSVAALLDSVLWTVPTLAHAAWRPSAAEHDAYGDALGRMDDDSSIFTRYYGEFHGKRVENHCPGAQVARQLIALGWSIVTTPTNLLPSD